MRLSIVVPVYNEKATLEKVLDRLKELKVEKEVVVVDDASTDGTRELLQGPAGKKADKVVFHDKNRGKGAALRSGFAHAAGEFVIVQDADLEYDPLEIPALLGPAEAGKADAVFGSRFVGDRPHRVLYFWHYVGNRFLTILSNMFTNLNLSDMETGYKLIRRDVLKTIALEEDRFGFEPEITAKLAHAGARIYEVGISYSGRTYAEGKKIGAKDGFRAIYCILKYGLFA